MQVAELKTKLDTFWKAAKVSSDIVFNIVLKSFLIVFISYVVASITSSIVMGLFSAQALQKTARVTGSESAPGIGKVTNFRELSKDIIGRNIFNSTGELPDEPDPSEGNSSLNAFNPQDKCQKPTLNIELLGIIDTGNPDTTLATIQEKGYTIADIYRSGDRIIGQDQALIYAIEDDKVILNNNGVKECLENSSVKGRKGLGSPASLGHEGAGNAPGEAVVPDEPGVDCPPSSTVTLEPEFVSEALGPGYSKILEAGRLVPFHRDNVMVGFKLIGVRGGSLWSRVNLGSGDVITSVNGTNMAQPEKGFAVYEALQDAKQLRIEFLKAGKSPCTLNVEIK